MAKKIKVDAGPRVATDLLAGLDPDNRQKVLEKMALIDPELTEALVGQLITLNDLPKMTIKMLQDFLKRVDQTDLILALRLCDEITQNYFISSANRSLALEITESLEGQKVPRSKCVEAQDKLLKLVRKMIDEGSLVLNSNDEYV